MKLFILTFVAIYVGSSDSSDSNKTPAGSANTPEGDLSKYVHLTADDLKNCKLDGNKVWTNNVSNKLKALTGALSAKSGPSDDAIKLLAKELTKAALPCLSQKKVDDIVTVYINHAKGK